MDLRQLEPVPIAFDDADAHRVAEEMIMTSPAPTPPRETLRALADTLPDLAKRDRERPVSLVVTAAGATDRGRVRKTNQDQFLIATLTPSLWVEQSTFPQARVHCGDRRGRLLVVADGVGGNPAGERASVLAVEAVEGFMIDAIGCLPRWGETQEIMEELKTALGKADEVVGAATEGRPEWAAMATTLTLACWVDDELYVAHAGDSRCYLLRRSTLHHLTHDDTVVNELLEAGIIDAEAAKRHELRHMVTNVVGGGGRGVKPEVHEVVLASGDTLLLCTDGLTEMLDDQAIAAILEATPDPRLASQRLVAAANDAGGVDNITAVVAHFEAA